jgi:hypothetical protein
MVSIASTPSIVYGDVICGTITICLTTYTIANITLTTIGTTYGSIMPLIILCAFKYVLSYSLFTHKLEAPPSSTLFFLLRALLKESVAAFFLFSNGVCIFSLVLLTLAGGFYELSF